MHILEHRKATDWPKLGTSLLIAAALVVAVRTARWAAEAPEAMLSDVDVNLDKEIAFAVRVADRVLHALLRKRPGMFPERLEPVYAPGAEDIQE